MIKVGMAADIFVVMKTELTGLSIMKLTQDEAREVVKELTEYFEIASADQVIDRG